MKSERSMFEAAIESARIFNRAVVEVARTGGLVGALSRTSSVDDVIQRMAFRPERREQVQTLLNLLSHEGVLDKRLARGTVVFERRAGTRSEEPDADGPERYQPRMPAIEAWFGEGHSELIRASNKEFLGSDLSFLRSPDAALKFNREYEFAWRTNLTNPLYEFGRLICVRELVGRGSRFLDLACGPGFGVQRLAEFAAPGAAIVAVDKSHDFLDIARRGVYPGARIRYLQRDLNLGLPPLPRGGFDGVLFNGAFHFIVDKPARLREIREALRPGGLLALGHCFSRSGFADEPMHDFFFSLIEDRVYPRSWREIRSMVQEAGFAVRREFHRGSHSYLVAERLPDPVAPQPNGTMA